LSPVSAVTIILIIATHEAKNLTYWSLTVSVHNAGEEVINNEQKDIIQFTLLHLTKSQPKRAKKRRKIQPGAISRHKHSATRTGPPFIREKKNQAGVCALLFCPFFVLENYFKGIIFYLCFAIVLCPKTIQIKPNLPGRNSGSHPVVILKYNTGAASGGQSPTRPVIE
jgi:hypothetical protein